MDASYTLKTNGHEYRGLSRADAIKAAAEATMTPTNTVEQKLREEPNTVERVTVKIPPYEKWGGTESAEIIGEGMSDKDRETVERVAEALMSGRSFRTAAASYRSIVGYQPPASRRDYAKALATLGRMANESDALANVAEALVGALTLNGVPGDTVAKLYDAAADALGGTWFDTINAASPEPGRHRDNVKSYTLRDRILIRALLGEVASHFIPSGSKVGWALQALAEREGVSYRHLVTR